MRIFLATLLLLAVIPAYGSIIVTTNVSVLPTPPSTLIPDTPGAVQSNSTLFAFTEQTGLLLSQNVNVGISTPGTWTCCSNVPGATVEEGLTVNSYIVYAAPTSNITGANYTLFTGTIQFSPGETIAGIIIGYKNLFTTDSTFAVPGVTYPGQNDQTASLERGDTIIISPTGNSVYFSFHVNADENGEDVIRILTTTPEPGDFVLLGSGLIGLAVFASRRRARRVSLQSPRA